jgi:microcystin-dependent protein
MSSPFIGEIRMFAGNFAPLGWSFCDGSVVAIDQNTALFQLIGTTYGGDGVQTFNLPDLRSRVPVHVGPGFTLAQTGGEETVTLTVQQIPSHFHVPRAKSVAGNQASPAGGVWAASSLNQYTANAPSSSMDAAALGSAGGGQAHDNMVPFLVINFILSLFGVFPSQ